MATITLGLANYADEAVLSGGNWLTSLPRSNLQTRRLSKVARTSDALAASTQFAAALVKARPVRVLALIAHNLSVSSTVRIVGADAADFATPLYDSGAVQAWPAGVIPQDLLEWEDDNFWLGTISEEAIAGYRAPFIHLLPSPVTARYWRVEITDPGNSSGWVHVGRLYLANTWTPQYNMQYGTELGFDDVSMFETSLTGEEFFESRRKRRNFKFNLSALSVAEGYQSALELDRLAGTTGEVLVIADAADTTNAPRRNFVGRLASLSGVVHAHPTLMEKAYEIVEIL